MYKYLLLTFCLISFSSHSQESIHNLKDSLWIDFNAKNDLFISHIVQKSETLYSLSKKYVTSIDHIRATNKIENGIIGLGDTLRLPLSTQNIQMYCDADILRPKNGAIPIMYEVKQGDKLFHIAKRVFKTSLKCISNNNKLSSELLFVGQKLMIGYYDSNKNNDQTTVSKKSDNTIVKPQRLSSSLENEFWTKGKLRSAKNTKGAASLMKGTESQPLLVLFNGASSGEIVRLYNKTTEKSCYARVVGTIPAKLSRQNIIIVTKLVQTRLGINEDRFNVSIEYFK